MLDSTDTTITTKAIHERANSDAMSYMPELPKENTLEAWGAFVSDLEDIDAQDIACQCCEWDWVIYYHRAMELCQAVPRYTLSEAESEYEDLGFEAPAGLFEYASQLAALIVQSAIRDEVENVRDELLDMAHTHIENEGW